MRNIYDRHRQVSFECVWKLLKWVWDLIKVIWSCLIFPLALNEMQMQLEILASGQILDGGEKVWELIPDNLLGVKNVSNFWVYQIFECVNFWIANYKLRRRKRRERFKCDLHEKVTCVTSLDQRDLQLPCLGCSTCLDMDKSSPSSLPPFELRH